MATYVPSQLISPKAMGNGAANIATWRKQNTAGANSFDVHRTLVAESVSAARTITIQQGATAADTAAQRILDAYVLTAAIQFVQNWWVAVPNNDYFQGFANNTDIQAATYGYAFTP
jgi:hypothetical protein